MFKKPPATSYKLPTTFHFIGIGGSGMSGLARILKAEGKKISGSSDRISSTTLALQKEGIKIHIEHDAKNIGSKTEMVVYSSAVPTTNVERKETEKRNIPQLSYAEAVGVLTKNIKTVCICGTHGKTTTTAMTAAVFLKNKQDPTVIVGSTIKELDNRNARFGKSDYFIVESCEYRRAFLNFHPQTIIITNIEADHLDYYRDLKDYKNAFEEFTKKLPKKNGLLIANIDDKNIFAILKILKKERKDLKIITYGKSSKADYQLKKNIITHQRVKIAELQLKIPGDHNLMNATAVIALAKTLKLAIKPTIEALENYTGSARRFETKGKIGKTIVIDDYAHHPTEIKATLDAARQKFGPKAKILCVFQPHQYSRTLKLLDEFSKSFQDADEVIIPNIYEVRDTAKDIQSINPTMFVKKIQQHHANTSYGHGFEKTMQYIQKNVQNYDIIMTLGAGDIEKLSEKLTRTKEIL